MEFERKRIDLAVTDLKLAEGDGKTGTFSGYGAVFNNEDEGGDLIERGAFKNTLRDWEGRGKLPPMLLQHGGGGLFGGGSAIDGIPIGKWLAMEENAKGLKVEGQLFALNTERGQYIYEGLKSGELDGLSIGYRIVKFINGMKPNEPRRKLQELNLVELSVVTFPMNDKARVAAVKAAEHIKTIREFEAFLRDAGGFSRGAAKAIAAGGFKANPEPRDEDGATEWLEGLRRRAAALRA